MALMMPGLGAVERERPVQTRHQEWLFHLATSDILPLRSFLTSRISSPRLSMMTSARGEGDLSRTRSTLTISVPASRSYLRSRLSARRSASRRRMSSLISRSLRGGFLSTTRARGPTWTEFESSAPPSCTILRSMIVSSLTDDPLRRVVLDRCVRAGETSLITSFFSKTVSLMTPGDESRLDRLREWDRCDLGDGERTDRPSQSRTDRGASASGTVLNCSIFSVFSMTTSPRILGARDLVEVVSVGGASIRRVVVTGHT